MKTTSLSFGYRFRSREDSTSFISSLPLKNCLMASKHLYNDMAPYYYFSYLCEFIGFLISKRRILELFKFKCSLRSFNRFLSLPISNQHKFSFCFLRYPHSSSPMPSIDPCIEFAYSPLTDHASLINDHSLKLIGDMGHVIYNKGTTLKADSITFHSPSEHTVTTFPHSISLVFRQQHPIPLRNADKAHE